MKKLTFWLLACLFALTAGAQPIFVKPAAEGGNDENDGLTWETAKATIAVAMREADKQFPMMQGEDPSVWVKKGTYTEPSWGEYTGTPIFAALVYGGFKGDEESIEERKTGTHPWELVNETVITFDQPGIALSMNAPADNEGALLSVVLDGLSFRNGKAGFASSNGYFAIKNCIFAGNVTSSPLLDVSITRDNIYFYLESSLFENNESQGSSSLVSIMKMTGEVVATDQYFIGNKANGPAIFMYKCMENTTSNLLARLYFCNNEAKQSIANLTKISILRSLFYNNTGNTLAINDAEAGYCTIANNKGRNFDDGGISLNGKCRVYNTVVRGNEGAYGATVTFSGDAANTLIETSAFAGAAPEGAESTENLIYALNDFAGFVAPSTFKGSDKTKAAELADANWRLTDQPHGMNANKINQPTTFDFDGNSFGPESTTVIGAYQNGYAAREFPVLTVAAGESGTASTEKSGSYYMGAGIELTASPAADYSFINWTNEAGEAASEEAEFTYVMPETSVTLTANFGKGGSGITDTEVAAPVVRSRGGKLIVDHSAPVSIEVFTAAGIRVATEAAAESHSISLPQGLYIVIVNDNGTQFTGKVAIGE